MRATVRKTMVSLVILTLSGLWVAAPAAGTTGSHSVPSPGEVLDGRNPEGERRTLKTAALATGFVLGSLAAILEVESDRAYSRYLDVAHPVAMDSHYDKAERLRNLSSAALIGAQVCAVAFVVLSLSERTAEPVETGTVRISLYTGPCRAGVTLEW